MSLPAGVECASQSVNIVTEKKTVQTTVTKLNVVSDFVQVKFFNIFLAIHDQNIKYMHVFSNKCIALTHLQGRWLKIKTSRCGDDT